MTTTSENLIPVYVAGSGPPRLMPMDAVDTIMAGSTAAGYRIQALTETLAVADFTDGGGASGTITMTGSIPAGAYILGCKVLVPGGFAGDTSAALTIGDGSDADRYNTSADVFSTAATGVEAGPPTGALLQVAAVQPVLTVTSATDFGLVVTEDVGSVTVSIFYIDP